MDKVFTLKNSNKLDSIHLIRLLVKKLTEDFPYRLSVHLHSTKFSGKDEDVPSKPSCI